MKATFIVGGLMLALSTACVDLELPGDGSADGETDEVGDDTGCEPDCDPTHQLSGEVMLFVNARLTDDASSFQAHLPLPDGAEGTYLGNAIYLYDPDATCDDGTTDCRLVQLGNMRLDEQLGAISVADNSLRKFVVRDLAWDAEHGLWGATFDPLNDEWSISRLTIDDWSRTDNSIGVERWVIPPGAAESPSTDPCYWFESVSGLGFAGDELLLGVRGAGSSGLIADGSLLRVDMDVFDQGHCLQPSDVSQDPEYYACDVVCEQWCTFGSKIGVAGDVIEALDGDGASAWLRSEDDSIMALERNEMQSCAAPAEGEVSMAVPDNVFDDDVTRGDEIEGLARFDGMLYGVSVLGKVYRIDEVERIVEEIDDLSGFFPVQGLRLRGATTVVLPASE